MDQPAVQALVTDSTCALVCSSEKTLLAMMVYLLWSDIHPGESMTEAEVQTLVTNTGCIPSCMSHKMLLAAIVQLLSEGAGGGAGVTHVELVIRDSPSTPEPDPADTTHAWLLFFRNGAPSLTWDTTAQAWI